MVTYSAGSITWSTGGAGGASGTGICGGGAGGAGDATSPSHCGKVRKGESAASVGGWFTPLARTRATKTSVCSPSPWRLMSTDGYSTAQLDHSSKSQLAFKACDDKKPSRRLSDSSTATVEER